MNNGEPKKGGVQSRSSLYAYVSKYSKEVIDFEIKTMKNPKVQMSVRVSCANKLLDKLLANLAENDVKVAGNYNVNIDGLIGLSKTSTQAAISDSTTPESTD